MTQTTYAYNKAVDQNYETTVQRTKEVLKKHGFGILTTIDIKEKMKEKLDKDMEEYIILGACNPPSAYQALQAEIEIGLMLPCNVIVYNKDGQTYVSAIRPTQAMGMIENSDLPLLAKDIEDKLKTVIEEI